MKKLMISLIFLLISSTAFNQTLVEKTIKVKSQKSVNLDFDFADEIKITGWDKNEIYVKATVSINDNEDNDAFTMEAKEHLSSIDIFSEIKNMKEISKNKVIVRKSKDGERTTTYHDGWHIDMDIYFEVYIPKNMEIDLETISGDIILTNTLGELNIESISGFIDLSIDKNANASIKTSTISGGVYSNHDIKVQKKSNDKKYHMIIGRSPKFDLNGGGRYIKLETISGDIYIRK